MMYTQRGREPQGKGKIKEQKGKANRFHWPTGSGQLNKGILVTQMGEERHIRFQWQLQTQYLLWWVAEALWLSEAEEKFKGEVTSLAQAPPGARSTDCHPLRLPPPTHLQPPEPRTMSTGALKAFWSFWKAFQLYFWIQNTFGGPVDVACGLLGSQEGPGGWTVAAGLEGRQQQWLTGPVHYGTQDHVAPWTPWQVRLCKDESLVIL